MSVPEIYEVTAYRTASESTTVFHVTGKTSAEALARADNYCAERDWHMTAFSHVGAESAKMIWEKKPRGEIVGAAET